MRILEVIKDDLKMGRKALRRILRFSSQTKKTNGTYRKYINNSFITVAAGMVLWFTNPPGAAAFITVKTSASSKPAHWNKGQTLTYRVNTTNKNGLASHDIFQILTTSLQRWQQTSLSGFSFLFYQGTDTSRYPNQIGMGADNSVFFTSQAANSQNKLACGVVGLTSLWIDSGSGSITKADVRINDECYQFTTNPSSTGVGNQVYLGDLVTHEFGHSLGLDHSQNLQSTMVFTAAKQTYLPSCDDQAGMRSLYAENRGTGKLTGRLFSETNSAVFGAHVSAISLARGVALSSAITDRDGSYVLDELEPGPYVVVAEPFYPGANSLGSYYSGSSGLICNGKNFERSFQKQNGKLSSFQVTANQTLDIGTITASCTKSQSQGGGLESNFSSAPSLTLDPSNPLASQATLGAFTSNSDHFYKIPNAFGKIKASVTAYGIYSIADVNVRFLNAAGQILTQNSSQNLMSLSTSGYTNYDAASEIILNQMQDIYVYVYTRRFNSSSEFPSLSIGVDNHPYYVLGVSNSDATDFIYQSNARCEMSDQFSAYNSLGEAPALSNAGGTGKKDNSSAGFGCGTLASATYQNNSNNNDDDDGPFGQSSGGLLRFMNLLLMMASCFAFWRMFRKTNPQLS